MPPGGDSGMSRAAMFTALPRTSRPRRSMSPTWMLARSSRGGSAGYSSWSAAIACWMAATQRRAVKTLSNSSRKLSPAVSISRPS